MSDINVADWESEGGRLVPFRMRDIVGVVISKNKGYKHQRGEQGSSEGWITKGKLMASVNAHNAKVRKMKRKNWSIPVVYHGWCG